jgi:malate dehydrogenase (oxaloacetate-decarboxylating)
LSSSSRDVSLLEVVERVKPTVLIGCSTAPGTFTKEVVEAMMRGLEDDVHPIIMPLSNPSRLVEAKPADILHWTNGKALVATGSPFGTVKMDVGGKEKEFV